MSARPVPTRSLTGALDGHLVPLAAIPMAALAGAAVAVAPMLGVGIAVATTATLLTLSRALPAIFLVALGVLLTGYAFLGRSFAYLGAPPIHVGEVVLALAALTALRLVFRRWGRLELLLGTFMLWGAARTIPYLASDGMNALRDGALWGYALFALAVSAAVRPEHFDSLRKHYLFLIPLFLGWVGVSAALSYAPSLPTIPGTDIGVVYFKGGDMGVHLAGVIAFLIAGLVGTGTSLALALLFPLWLVAVAVAGSINRGGLFAAFTGWSAAVLVRPPARWWHAFALAGLVLAGAAIVDPDFDVGRTRTVSLDQVVTNLTSVVMNTGDGSLDGTRDFRLRWWGEIVDYTVHGPYFWTGKGFGVNLADDDGYQIRRDGSVRAPHNTHLTVLARMGVPGLALWVLLQIAFGVQLLRAFLSSRRSGATMWCRIDAWLFAYWLAMLANTSFDPYLEGPQGGIWFWSVFGLGLAASRFQLARPRDGAGARTE